MELIGPEMTREEIRRVYNEVYQLKRVLRHEPMQCRDGREYPSEDPQLSQGAPLA